MLERLGLLGHKSTPVQVFSRFFEGHPGLWTFGSFAVSAVSAVVSAIGLYLIWGQLKASRQALRDSATSARAAADAARTAYSATRPWLKFEVRKAHIYLLHEQADVVGCQIDYTLENVGETPAIAVGVLFKPLPSASSYQPDVPEELAELWTTEVLQPRVLFPGDRVEEGISKNFPFPELPDESMVGFKLVTAAVYKATPEGVLYWTPAAFGLQHETPPPDLVYRFWRGMGAVPCHVLRLSDLTPPPT